MCMYCEDKNKKELLMLDDIWGGLVFNPDTARLEEKHISEDSGKTLTTRVVEIDYCPFCGKRITPLELDISGSKQIEGISSTVTLHLDTKTAFQFLNTDTESPDACCFINILDDYGISFNDEQKEKLHHFFEEATKIYNS